MDNVNEIIYPIIVGSILFILFAITMVAFYGKLRSREKIQELKYQFREQMLQSNLDIYEQTLDQLSMEIHDNVGQVLSLAKIQANLLVEKNVVDNELAEAIKENISRALADLRSMSKSMNADYIRNRNICQAIEDESERIKRLGLFDMIVSISGNVTDLSAQSKLIIFRMFQECLQNIIKHANASSVRISIEFTNEKFLLSVYDNGNGFDNTKTANNSVGLSSMISKAKIIKGDFNLTSKAGQGTSITISCPIC